MKVSDLQMRVCRKERERECVGSGLSVRVRETERETRRDICNSRWWLFSQLLPWKVFREQI